MNLIQCTERIFFHIEQLPDGYHFKEGRSSVKDEAHPGRPVSVTSENDVTVQSIIQRDSQYTVEEISDLSGLSSSYVFITLKEK